jgi:hypothetical protein
LEGDDLLINNRSPFDFNLIKVDLDATVLELEFHKMAIESGEMFGPRFDKMALGLHKMFELERGTSGTTR